MWMSSVAELGLLPEVEKGVDWDPEPGEETWYRSVQTGDRGFLVKRAGRDWIRLDRPNDPTAQMPFDPLKWVVDKEDRPLSSLACAQVAQAADQVLCRALGLYDKAGKEWISLPEKIRLAWMREGPKKPAIRRKLYIQIRAVLADLEG